MTDRTINKIISKSPNLQESLLDLTSDSVSPENLLLNETAHNREGEGIIGKLQEGGTSDYDALSNRPQINSNLLTGNKTGGQLGLQNKNLDSPIVIGGQTANTVEGALSALNESKSDLVNGKVPVNELPVYTPVIGSIQSIGGIVPPSSSGDEDKYLRGDGTWAKPSGGGGGVSDYDDLINRPKINGTTLSGDKTGTQLGLQNVVLASALTIGGQVITEVEEALGSLAGISKPMTGATSSAAGEGGFVPSPSAGDENKALFGDGTWKPVSGGGGGHTILDEDGVTYPQRSKLQFEGAIVSDDETNDKTVVETVNPVDYEEDMESIQHQLTDQTNVLGAKNLLEITASTQTKNGITLTVNRDSKGNVKSIVVSGTPTATSDFILNADVRDAIAQGNGFILTGCPSGGASSTYGLALDPVSDKRSKYDTGSGVQFDSNYFDYSEDGAIAAKIHIGSAQVGNEINKTFYPMLRLASDPDDTYVPYAMTNRELTEVKSIAYTTMNQSLYSVDTLSRVVKCGRICIASLLIKSISVESAPSGQQWTQIISGLPLSLSSSNITVSPSALNHYPLQVNMNSNATSIYCRGGSVDETYRFTLIYITK